MSRITDLLGLRPQIEIESPEAGYVKGMKAVRGIVQEQGQVMSAALENNHNLYHSNKQLKNEKRQLADRVHQLEHENHKLTLEVAALSTPVNRSLHELEAICKELSAANETMRRELTAQQFPEYDSDARHAALAQMKAMAVELKHDPDVPSQDEINARLDRGLTCREMTDMEKLLQEQAIAAVDPDAALAAALTGCDDEGTPDTMPGLR